MSLHRFEKSRQANKSGDLQKSCREVSNKTQNGNIKGIRKLYKKEKNKQNNNKIRKSWKNKEKNAPSPVAYFCLYF